MQAMASDEVPEADIIAVWHTVWLTPELLKRFTKAKVSGCGQPSSSVCAKAWRARTLASAPHSAALSVYTLAHPVK